jgi:hypothetical protein
LLCSRLSAWCWGLSCPKIDLLNRQSWAFEIMHESILSVRFFLSKIRKENLREVIEFEVIVSCLKCCICFPSFNPKSVIILVICWENDLGRTLSFITRIQFTRFFLSKKSHYSMSGIKFNAFTMQRSSVQLLSFCFSCPSAAGC